MPGLFAAYGRETHDALLKCRGMTITPFPLLNPSASTISGNVRAMEANVRAIEVPKPIIEQAMPIFD